MHAQLRTVGQPPAPGSYASKPSLALIDDRWTSVDRLPKWLIHRPFDSRIR